MTLAPSRPDTRFAPREGPLVIAVMDGVGVGPGDDGDAVHRAAPTNLQRIWSNTPTRSLAAHGLAVGLPSDKDIGNSEVGHNALGAGRVVRQGAALVNDAFASGALLASETWHWLVNGLADGNALHLCGLLSDGNVHADIKHVIALIAGAAQSGVRRVRVHALADGRDVEDPSYERYMSQLDEHLRGHQQAGRDYRIASGGGRMTVTMDRYEADWRIVERGWRAHVQGDAPGFASWQEAVGWLRAQPGGQSDQTLGAYCITEAGQPVGTVRDGDAFVLWNFRGDRAIELSRAFDEDATFDGFERGIVPQVRFAGMMQYDGDLKLPRRFLVTPPKIDSVMTEHLVVAGLRSFAVSETQKFGHVTYFWNGNRSGRIDDALERWQEIPSDNIAFDRAPAMKAAEITNAARAAVTGPVPPHVLRLNYANGDMVGHTGNLEATIAAITHVDREVGRLIELVRSCRGTLVLTADHGNADDMWLRGPDGSPRRNAEGVPQPRTSHTLAPVPLSIVDFRSAANWTWRDDVPKPGLANVAATCFSLLGLQAPEHFAQSLIRPR